MVSDVIYSFCDVSFCGEKNGAFRLWELLLQLPLQLRQLPLQLLQPALQLLQPAPQLLQPVPQRQQVPLRQLQHLLHSHLSPLAATLLL